MQLKPGDKKPLGGVSVKYGVSTEAAVRGMLLSVDQIACFAALDDGRWRYWLRQGVDDDGDGFADRIGRLKPLRGLEFMGRLNDHATGPIAPEKGEPTGEAVIYDLADDGALARFALACAAGEALARSSRLRFSKLGRPWYTARAFQDALPELNTNLSLWGLESGGDGLAFLPDAVLLRMDGFQWVVPYAETSVRSKASAEGQVLTLALSDQRARILVADTECGERAGFALERLIEFEAKRRAHVGPKRSPISDRLRASNGSVGRIVVKPKSERIPAKIVIDLPDEECPGPCPDDGGIPTKAPIPEDDLVFCDDSGLVFSTKSPVYESDEGPVEEPPAARQPTPPPPPRRRPRPSGRPADAVRMAVGALLSYVAKSADGFAAPEQAAIRSILQLPRGFPLASRFSAVRPGSRGLDHALGVLRRLNPKVRQRVLRDCERVAMADGKITEEERSRLDEIREALAP